MAGVPMTIGSRFLPGFVPIMDPTVAEWLLDAGATTVGKLDMDSFGMGGANETSGHRPAGVHPSLALAVL